MKPKILVILFISVLTLALNAQDKIFEKIQNKTWFDHTGFAGESIVFIKSDSGKIQAIRQIHGSGIPVLFSVIHDVEIHNDTIILLNRPTNIIYTCKEEGLLNNGSKLSILFDEPIIYVCSEKRKFIDTRINVNTLTKISFETNEVYINEKVYNINLKN